MWLKIDAYHNVLHGPHNKSRERCDMNYSINYMEVMPFWICFDDNRIEVRIILWLNASTRRWYGFDAWR